MEQTDPLHLGMEELESGLDRIRSTPREEGAIALIVRRPDVDQREVLEAGQLDEVVGLVGDNWQQKGSRHTEDGSAHPEMQLTLMNARVIELLARTKDRWPLAGDQIYVDMDLGVENLPTGARLQVGEAIVEVTAKPHRGCNKFVDRFGKDALLFIHNEEGKRLRMRGVNAKVVQGGAFRTGDVIRKI